MGNSKILLRTVIASLLLHLALVWILPGLPAGTPAPSEVRLQLALRPPSEPPRTLTETPESARLPEAPADPTHVAEHHARAQNPESAPEIDGRPRHTGDLDLFDFRPADLLREEVRPEPVVTPPPAPAAADLAGEPAPEMPVPSRQASAERAAEAAPDATAGVVTAGAGAVDRPSGAAVPPESNPGQRQPAPPAVPPRPRHDSPRSGVQASGQLSLSTYAWAYAPYLRHLRDAISARWYPPYAFDMGLVEGEGAIFFRVLPDGSTPRIEIVSDSGHPSLVRAARNAVDHAGPLPPLPDHFPDPWLDVTWNYRYVILRR